MSQKALSSVVQHLRRLTSCDSVETSDAQLLEHYIAAEDQAAFETLLHRHGPMVLNLCTRLLHDGHQAEDAFQATFLVLARKAGAIRKHQSLASWLYGVAYRISFRAKASAARQRRQERQVQAMSPSCSWPDIEDHDDFAVLADELQRLPEKYRAPLVLCYLEGKTNEAAARELGAPKGSMAARLAQGRDLLRERLVGRGLVLSAGGLAAALSQGAASAALPTTLLASTLQAAALYAASQPASAGLSASAAALADGVIHTMHATKVKLLTALLVLVSVVGLAGGLCVYQVLARPEATIQLPQDPQAVVLSLDYLKDNAAAAREPYLTIRADGTAVFGNPSGDSQRLEGKLTPQEVHELLHFAIREQDVFGCDSRQMAALLPNQPTAASVVVQVRTEQREHQVRWADVGAVRVAQLNEAKLRQAHAVQQRLERVVTWLQAGGHQGIDTALQQANEQLAQQFPEAPALTAGDLRTASLAADGRGELVFERQGVAADRNPFSFIYARVERSADGAPTVTIKADLAAAEAASAKPVSEIQAFRERVKAGPLKVEAPHWSTDATVKIDYPIIYVRAPRSDDPKVFSRWADIQFPFRMDAGADLMILYPDGKEEVLVEAGEKNAVIDPAVSFDAEWVYYSLLRDVKSGDGSKPSPAGADIYKVHVKSRKTVQLTHQAFTPNEGAANWSKDFRSGDKGKEGFSYGVGNTAPCPLPGGKVMFTSNRNGYHFQGRNNAVTTQLFVMDSDGNNVELVGHLNLGAALHPTILKDGRVLFSTVETQGIRGGYFHWGIWSIHPDGTGWNPVVSAFSSNGIHFQAQLSDENVVVEAYYPANDQGFGTFLKFPAAAPEGQTSFGPGFKNDPRNPPLVALGQSLSFSPYGIQTLTRFANHADEPALLSVANDPKSPRVGKVTHPWGAPDNHLLTVWSPGPVCLNGTHKHPTADGGIYIIKGGRPIDEPGQMVLIKNDPKFNEQYPRPLVPYQRIYGVPEPKARPTLANDGKLSKHLPAGTPYGIFGTSSLYKRESAPEGAVPQGKVTAEAPPPPPPWAEFRNWTNQGADAGKYSNDDIWGIRILFQEPNTDLSRRYHNWANERLRIWAEIPVRKINGAMQPVDPDGNPDTSFLVRIPAQTSWMIQTIDNRGMVLNSSQTWHQLRPGEVRNDCGGCHAHSQKPTRFDDTLAAKPDYVPWVLEQKTPLFTTKAHDKSGKQWDLADKTGLRYEDGVKNVEYFRDVKPILQRSCVACHSKDDKEPAAALVLDADDETVKAHVADVHARNFPGTYFRLALDNGLREMSHHSPLFGNQWGRQNAQFVGWAHQPAASRYIAKFQSRRSLLTWKIYGERLDGYTNDDFPSESPPGSRQMVWKGKPVDLKEVQGKIRSDIDYHGSIMPPPEAVAGTYERAGKKIKVAPLSDEDRLTLVRWIDLGCPIDFDNDPHRPEKLSRGWMTDEQRPTLTLASPRAGANREVASILIGMHDYLTGLDPASLTVTADFRLDGVEPGQNLASKFKAKGDGIFELTFAAPLIELPTGKLHVSVKDKQGNLSRIERTFSVVGAKR